MLSISEMSNLLELVLSFFPPKTLLQGHEDTLGACIEENINHGSKHSIACRYFESKDILNQNLDWKIDHKFKCDRGWNQIYPMLRENMLDRL